MVRKKIDNKDNNLISIEESAALLGFKPLGRNTPELLSVLQIDFLNEFGLNKVELDSAFKSNLTGKINTFCFNRKDVENKLKELQGLEELNNDN